ncbi:lipoma-preferred partner homolog [Galendromus occidentalis]|uniref:Zyxin n=1 Tax=Galendromus occidentalis TaxID=34638 RepID=A0AAJ6VUK3_9ACAR|nr:lipoma-preferred partner homolog [Galendromus occidentalis]
MAYRWKRTGVNMAYTDDLLEKTLEELERLSTAPSPRALFEDEVYANKNVNAPRPVMYKPMPPIPKEDHMSLYSNGRISRPSADSRASNPPPPPAPSSVKDYEVQSDTGSIYEPLRPRAPSQLSGYSGCSSAYSGSSYSNNSSFRGSSSFSDYYEEELGGPEESFPIGSCVVCHEDVMNDGSGCSAMDKVYHIACFKCHVCKVDLQGRPFFAVHGEPYCEEDYLDTLEKCSKCQKPILDRILRATGKPYHPACFTCSACGNALDGIPFTVDAANNIYCIPDFHKKFAPRCCVCKEPIMPQGKGETVRIVALDRSFHVNCYKCEDCGLVLGKENGCYPLDEHILCRDCNARRVQRLTQNPGGLVTEL